MRVTTGTVGRGYVSAMVTRIVPKKFVRLYLAEWREAVGMSQEKLAEEIGSTKSSISRWKTRFQKMNFEEGRDITFGAISAICEALGIDVADLRRPPEVPSADAELAKVDDVTRSVAMDMIRGLKRVN